MIYLEKQRDSLILTAARHFIMTTTSGLRKGEQQTEHKIG
jgi:hypothetical protein